MIYNFDENDENDEFCFNENCENDEYCFDENGILIRTFIDKNFFFICNDRAIYCFVDRKNIMYFMKKKNLCVHGKQLLSYCRTSYCVAN